MPHPQRPLHPSLKVPSRWALLQVPQTGPLGRRCPSPEPFLNPDILFLSLKSPDRQTPSRFPNRAPMKREVCLQGVLCISQKPHLSGSPVKEPSLKVPLWSPSQRDAPPLEPSFFHLSKSPVYEPPHTHTHPRFPSAEKEPPWREMPVSGDFLNISSWVPSEGAPTPRPPQWSLFREREASSTEAPLSISQSPR